MGASFALVRIFWASQTPSLVSRPKIFTNTKAIPQILELFFVCEKLVIARFGVSRIEAIQSYRHTERSEVSKQNQICA